MIRKPAPLGQQTSGARSASYPFLYRFVFATARELVDQAGLIRVAPAPAGERFAVQALALQDHFQQQLQIGAGNHFTPWFLHRQR